MSIGFGPDGDRRQREITNNKNQKGNIHVRILPKDVFGFAEHQEKATFGLVNKLILTRASVNSILRKDYATIVGKIKIINSIEWYAPH